MQSDKLNSPNHAALKIPVNNKSMPMVQVVKRSTFICVGRGKQRESSSASKRPPSSGSAGSRFNTSNARFPKKSRAPTADGSNSFALPNHPSNVSSNDIKGPASKMAARLDAERVSSSSNRSMSPSGVSSAKLGGQWSSMAAKPCAPSCSIIDPRLTASSRP